MVEQVNLVLGLICHHGDFDAVVRDALLILKVSVEKRIPITYFFSGKEIKALIENREMIYERLGVDVIALIQSDLFINPRFGNCDSYKSELAIMPLDHVPLVQPWAQDLWGQYFGYFLNCQVGGSIKLAQEYFYKTPVTILPPDGVYAPAAAHTLKHLGIDTVVISGESFRENKHSLGILYWASDLRHLVRTPDIQPQISEFNKASDFVDTVQGYGYEHDIPFVVAVCDSDEFNGMRNLTFDEGIARLCCIGDEAFGRLGFGMVNCNAAAHWNQYQEPVTNVWSWDNVYGMIHEDGNIGWIDSERNGLVGHALYLLAQSDPSREGFNKAKYHLGKAGDIALRNCYFCHSPRLSDLFYENIYIAIDLLQ